MTDKLLYSGKWFLPNNKEKRLHGRLYQNSENRFVLELVGGFNDPNKQLLQLEEFEIILGESLFDGKKITLWNCFESFSTFPFTIETESKIICSQVFIGEHYQKYSDIKCNKISIENFELIRWLGIWGTTFKNNSLLKEYSIDYKKPEELVYEVNGEFKFIISFGYSLPLHSIEKLELLQNCNLTFEFKEEKSINDLRDFIFHFENLETIFIQQKVNTKSIKIYVSDDYSKPIDILQMDINSDIKFKQNSVIIKFSDIASRFEDILSIYYKRKEDFKRIVLPLVLDKKKKFNFVEEEFLTITRGLEVYYDRFAKNQSEVIKSQYKKDYAENLGKVSNALKGSLKEWFESTYMHHTGINYTMKLITIIESLDHNGIYEIIGSDDKEIKEFCKTIILNRNYYTHFNDSIRKKAFKGIELYNIKEKSKVLLYACLLKELKFSKIEINLIINSIYQPV